MSTSRLIITLTLALAALGCADRSSTAERSGTIALGDGRLHFDERGRGPAVVLIHGGNMDSRMWDGQVEVLARNHRVVRYDVRGFGESSPATTPYQSHRDLAVLFDSLGIDRATLIGLSLGGRIALDFALAYPTRVSGLVLSGPGMSGWPDWSSGDTAWQSKAAIAVKAKNSEAIAAAWLSSDYMRPAMEHPDLVPILTKLALANTPNWITTDAEEAPNPPTFGRLGMIQVPVLVLIGERDSPPIHRIVDSIAARVPGARVVRFPGAGHILNMEEPVRFNQLVTEFVDRP